jgi:transposase-like protein
MAKPVLSDPRFFNEEAAFAYVEAHLWPEGPTCPHCGATAEKIGRLEGVRSKPSRKHPEGVVQIGLRKCYACRQPFTVRKGTIFEDSHLPLRMWLQAIHLLCASKKGISTRQLQRMLNCGMKTAWHLSHRIREIMKPANEGIDSPVGGEGKTLEADLTFVGRKPGTKVRVGPSHMNAVLSLVERDGLARSFHVPNVRANTLHAVIENHASRKSDLMTDEENTFVGIGWNFASHGTVKHAIDEYVRHEGNGRVVTTNTVEGFFSVLKRGIYGTYQHVSEAHLQRYLTEFDFRYSNRERLGVSDVQRASRALKGAKGRRLTYETTH